MQRRIASLALAAAISSAAALAAQSNQRIDELLAQPRARLDSAAYIVLSASGRVSEDADPETALQAAADLGWVKAGAGPDSAVTASVLCYLVMRSLDLKGGLLYAIFPGPRYAYKDMVARSLIDDSGGPARTVSGDEVIRVLRAGIDFKGGAK
jgi:hypothetical protein